jgi:hypothetical protein
MVGIGFSYQDTRMLADYAMGGFPIGFVIKEGTRACIKSGEFIPRTDITYLAYRIDYGNESIDHDDFKVYGFELNDPIRQFSLSSEFQICEL